MSLTLSLNNALSGLQAAQTNLALISANIANANTPGYEALDIQPFSDVMDQTRLTMARTNVAHLGGVESDAAMPSRYRRRTAGTSPIPATASASSRR